MLQKGATASATIYGIVLGKVSKTTVVTVTITDMALAGRAGGGTLDLLALLSLLSRSLRPRRRAPPRDHYHPPAHPPHTTYYTPHTTHHMHTDTHRHTHACARTHARTRRGAYSR